MSLVIDCSIAVAWLMPDEAASVADAAIRQVIADGAVIPALFLLEVANVLQVNARRKRISQAAVWFGLADIRRLDLRQDPEASGTALREIVTLSERHELTTYDASYLELAIRLGMPLATLDVPLANAARAAGVPLFTP